MWCSVDSRAVISFCTSSRRCVGQRLELRRTAGGCCESDDRLVTRSPPASRRETSRPAAGPGRRCPAPRAAVCSSALVVLAPAAGPPAPPSAACRACSDSRICSRASSSRPLARQREHPIDGVPELRHRVAPRYCRCSGVRRATATCSSRFSASSRVERGSGRTAPTRPSADTARRCPACRACRGQRVQIVLDAQQLQRVLAVAIAEIGLQVWSTEICRVVYHA